MKRTKWVVEPNASLTWKDWEFGIGLSAHWGFEVAVMIGPLNFWVWFKPEEQ